MIDRHLRDGHIEYRMYIVRTYRTAWVTAFTTILNRPGHRRNVLAFMAQATLKPTWAARTCSSHATFTISAVARSVFLIISFPFAIKPKDTEATPTLATLISL